ncbi:hypothetical protein PHYC_01519 [Phycisphaerales bacterium]|nr:hypothetical protein PHYC_01519 [Phycisphaerales bacterium]
MRTRPRAFSLIELLVAIAVIAVLLAILLPTLAGAREAGRGAACLSNGHQLAVAWTAYGNDYRERVMPLSYWSESDIGTGDPVYWWGTYGSATQEIDYSRGFIAPYMGAELARNSVFECPSQPWGTYRPQAGFRQPTSTYGYNGYYLSPSHTPGWASQIGDRPWQRLFEIRRPSELFVFADTLLPVQPARNTALLDPPRLWDGFAWITNDYPTTAFRHHRGRNAPGAAMTARADGGARSVRADPSWILHAATAVGSVGSQNDPHYVPDAAEWR